METRFGKFITGKYFPKIFWTFYILLTLFLAAKTDWAFRILAGRTLGIPFALILLAAAVVFYGQKIARRLRGHAVKKALGFLTCLLIYDFLLTVLWTLLCLFLPLAEQAAGSKPTASPCSATSIWEPLSMPGTPNESYKKFRRSAPTWY